MEKQRAIYAAALKELPSVLSYYNSSHHSSECTIVLDWTPITTNVSKILSSKWEDRRVFKLKGELTIRKRSTAASKKKINKKYDLETLTVIEESLEKHYEQIFLALNIAAPGLANFAAIEIELGESYKLMNSIHDRYYSELFEGGLSYSLSNRWPIINYVSIAAIWKWVNQVTIDYGYRHAHTSIERAINSILQGSKICDVSPTTIIWLVGALESIYEIKKEDKKVPTLKRRICRVLDAPQNQVIRIQKAIHEMYEYRSKFAHGQLPIHRPSQDEAYIAGTIKGFDQRIGMTDLASAILVASLQKLVINNWHKFTFHEQMVVEFKGA